MEQNTTTESHITEKNSDIENIVTKILFEILNDLPVFCSKIEGFDEKNGFKKRNVENVEPFTDLNPIRTEQTDFEKSVTDQVCKNMTEQHSVTEKTVSTAALKFCHFPPDGNFLTDKHVEVVSSESETNVYDCFEKEQLFNALHLSPVTRNTVLLNAEERHKEDRKKESVHFHSPVAEVYEFVESQAVSENSTLILSGSDSEDLLLSQSNYREDSEVKSDFADSDQELSQLLNLDEADHEKSMDQGVMAAGEDSFNVELSENIVSDDSIELLATEKNDETNGEDVKHSCQTLRNDSISHSEKLLPVLPDVLKSNSQSDDLRLVHTCNAEIIAQKTHEGEESEQRLRKLQCSDAKKQEKGLKFVMTPEGEYSNITFADTSVSDKSSVENLDWIDTDNEEPRVIKNHSSSVSVNTDCKLYTEDCEMCVNDQITQSKTMSEELSNCNEITFGINKVSSLGNVESVHIMKVAEKSLKDSHLEMLDKNSSYEDDVLEREVGNNISFQATNLKDCKNLKIPHNIQQDISSPMTNYKPTDNITASDITRKCDCVSEIFMKLPQEQEDPNNPSQDCFISCDETGAYKESFSSPSEKEKDVYQARSISERGSTIGKDPKETFQNNTVSDSFLLKSQSTTGWSSDILNNMVKHGSKESKEQCTESGFESVYTDNEEVKYEMHENKLQEVGKREHSSPDTHLSKHSKKSKSDSEEKFTAGTRKRKLFGKCPDESSGAKMIKLCELYSTADSNEVKTSAPKMLKQLASDTLSNLDETILWNSSEKFKEPLEMRKSYTEATCKILERNLDSIAEKMEDLGDSAEKNLEAYFPDSSNISSTNQHTEEKQDELQSKAVAEINESGSVDTLTVPSENVADFQEMVECFRVDRDSQSSQESQGFITATELLSQTSQNSGSTGFIVSAGGLNGSQDITKNSADTELVRDEVNGCYLFGEQKGSLEHENDNLGTAEHPSTSLKKYFVDVSEEGNKRKIVEITEEGFKEERIKEEDHDITSSGSEKSNIKTGNSKHAVTDQDEQLDIDQLDMYVDIAIDQVVPGEDIGSTVRNADTQSENLPCKKGQSLELYSCDSDLCDEQGSPLCLPVNKSGKPHESCFNWKYRPSCDLDLGNDVPGPELPDEDNVIRITPLKTCGKPLRLGLSKRQPVKHSLHKLGMKK